MSSSAPAPAPLPVVIRADASACIGHGHVMRCLALAAALQRQGLAVALLMADQPGDARAAAAAAGVAWWPLPVVAPTADALASAALLRAVGGAELLVLDHYRLDAAWLQALRPWARRLMVIDDLADRPLLGDLLLDQNWHDDPAARYAGRWPDRAATLFGPAHALLRDEFAQGRAGRSPRDGRVQRLLLSFGGSDPAQATGPCLAALHRALPGLALDVVLGAGAANGAALQAQWQGVAEVTVTLGAGDMAARLAAADMFVGAGGSMTWERACLGLPGITLPVAANQQPLCARLAAEGLGIDLGLYGTHSPAALVVAVQTLATDTARLRHMGAGLVRLCDGRGAERVAAAALALPPLSLPRRAGSGS